MSSAKSCANDRQRGAVLVKIQKIPEYDDIINLLIYGEDIALAAEFKIALNAYLKHLVTSPVRSLSEVIAFNNKFSELVSSILHYAYAQIPLIKFCFCFLDQISWLK